MRRVGNTRTRTNTDTYTHTCTHTALARRWWRRAKKISERRPHHRSYLSISSHPSWSHFVWTERQRVRCEATQFAVAATGQKTDSQCNLLQILIGLGHSKLGRFAERSLTLGGWGEMRSVAMRSDEMKLDRRYERSHSTVGLDRHHQSWRYTMASRGRWIGPKT